MAAIVGLDWPAALALIPARADKERVQHLLRPYEAGLVIGAAALARETAKKEE